MKLSQPMIKLIIRLLILMMLFVIMFLISSFLYSARYWPDVYNYINANITIKRIPTISELELTILEVDYTTEGYTTTDVDYVDVSTIDDLDIDEFMKDEFNSKSKVKRNIVIEQLKDYIELPPRGIFVDYVFLEEPIKEDTSTENKVVDKNTKQLNEDTGNNIFKTSVTGIVIEDELPSEVSEEPFVTEKYYTVQPTKSTKSKRCVDKEQLGITDNTEAVTTENLPEHTTTKEGYLVGDDLSKVVDGVSKEPVVITTKANENELFDEDEATGFIKDSVDVSNLSTRGLDDVEMFTKKPEKLRILPDPICHGNTTCQDFARAVFPWVVTIFVNNNTKDRQFSYYCDGALLTEKVILTDARCMLNMFFSKDTWEPKNVLVFLGKGNLQTFGNNERVHKVREIIIHPNFTAYAEGKAVNDLALLVMEDAVAIQNNIQSACIYQEDGGNEAATTAWALNGALIPIFFDKDKSETCYNKDEDIFCATYDNEVALCPSYGGVYASRQGDRWCLQGIFHGDPADRGVCFTKNVYYTSLRNYLRWIDDTVEMYKNDIL